MDDFSPWDWADTFLLHEAACLIAGVPVVPKVTIVLEELPTYARPILKQLMIAWAIGERHRKSPEASFPNERTLQALPSDGTGHCLSTMFARDEIHRWVREMGRKSAYSFEPVVDSHSEEHPASLPPKVSAPARVAAPSRASRKPPWSAVAMPYMRQLYKDGKFKSYTVFYRALLQRADTPDSPFTKFKGELYCAVAGTTVAEGTVGTKWAEIRSR